MSREPGDPALRRFERDAVLACLAMAAVALTATASVAGFGTAARAALGVLGGGLLMAFSYRAIKGAADLLVSFAAEAGPRLYPAATSGEGMAQGDRGAPGRDEGDGAGPQARPDDGKARVLTLGRRVFLAVKFFTRYALLAVAAYVMLTCFRLHPVGVLAGATSPFVAALMQVGRMSRARARRQHP